MKKTILIVALAVSTITFGQEHKEKKEHHRKARMEQMKDFSAEQIATLKTKKTTLALDLTKAQQDKMYVLYLEEATDRKKHQAQREANKMNEKSKTSSEERFDRMNSNLDKKIAHKNQVKSILSDEQYKKWESLHQKNISKRRKHQKRKKMTES